MALYSLHKHTRIKTHCVMLFYMMYHTNNVYPHPGNDSVSVCLSLFFALLLSRVSSWEHGACRIVICRGEAKVLQGFLRFLNKSGFCFFDSLVEITGNNSRKLSIN